MTRVQGLAWNDKGATPLDVALGILWLPDLGSNRGLRLGTTLGLVEADARHMV